MYWYIAEAQVYGILRKECHPIALTVLVANDNMTASLTEDALRAADTTESVITTTDILKHRSVNHDYKQAQPPPEFDAVKSCSVLKTELESFGVMVIPVINRSKSYLTAVLKVLSQAAFPRSCELFWLIFTGHGQRSNICINGQLMGFDNIIGLASEVKMRYFAFFFECCQVNSDGITVSTIKHQHMTIYSSPPDQVSYYYHGVGLMVICLSEMLKGAYKKSMNELQLELRGEMIKRIQDVVVIPAEQLKDFLNRHLPVHTSTMYSDINLYEKTCDASKYESYINKHSKKICPK